MSASRFDWQPPEQPMPEDQTGAEWPKWVYPDGIPGVGRAVLVQNEDEESLVMGTVTFLHDGPDEPNPEADAVSAEAEAQKLGIKIDKRWGAKRIRQAIDDHRG